MIKKMLAERGLSVYAAAKGSGIPYTTLNELVLGKKKIKDCSVKTVAALAVYLGVSTDALIFAAENKQSISQSWQMKRYKQYRFPLICPSASYDASRVHPLKQRLIFALADALKADSRIESVTLFGGSTTVRCTKNSDIDVAIKLKPEVKIKEAKNEISEKIQEICDWNADIVWMDRVEEGSKLFNNIARGVVIAENK